MLLTEEQNAHIVATIKIAEKQTSGEIKVHIEANSTNNNTIERAKEIFYKLNLQETAQRNGVLFYVAVQNRTFAILGDEGINAVVPPNFWDTIKNNMREKFLARYFTEGLCEAIEAAGEQLKKYFPYNYDDINEISDEISMS